MNQYEKVLVELGEKHQLEPSKQWSPELRLIGMIAMNAIIFVGTKMLFKVGSSSEILNMISSAPKAPQQPSPKQESSQNNNSKNTKENKSMRGPSVDLDML